MTACHAVEADKQMCELLDRVERGEEIVLTRQGREVAKPTRVKDGAAAAARVKDALERLRATHEMLRARGVAFPQDEVRALRAEGRR